MGSPPTFPPRTVESTAEEHLDDHNVIAEHLVNLEIDDCVDVDTTTTPPTNGQALLWIAGESKWKPGDVDEVTPGSMVLNDLTDVDLISLQAGDLVKWDGTKLIKLRLTMPAPLPTNLVVGDAGHIEHTNLVHGIINQLCGY